MNPKKFYGLDHLRAFAIAYVFIFHYCILSGDQPSWLPGLARFGWTGVDLFFVLSGFLIASQLFEEIKKTQRISFKHFFLKRFFRIVPAFLVTVALYFCFPLFREKEHLPPLWKFLSFTQNFGLNLKDNGTFSHAWSLCVEEHFYLLLPLVLIALSFTRLRRAYWLLIALFIFGFIIRAYSFNHFYLPEIDDDNARIDWYRFIYYPTYTRLDGLLAGVSIAALYHFVPVFRNRWTQYGNRFFAGGLAILAGAYFLCADDPQSFNASVFGFPLVAVGYGCWVISAISPTSFLYQWKSRATTLVAALSYALYLTHKGIIHITQRLVAHMELNSGLTLLICILACVLAALALNRLIEKPFMRLRKRITRS